MLVVSKVCWIVISFVPGLTNWLEFLSFYFQQQKNLGFVSEQLDCVLLQQIYPLLYSASFPTPSTPWADEVTEKVIVFL